MAETVSQAVKQESSYLKQDNASSGLGCFRPALCLPCGSFINPEIARTVHVQTFTDDCGSVKTTEISSIF